MSDKRSKLTINTTGITNPLSRFDKQFTQGISMDEIQQKNEGEIIKIDRPLFKKTLSRLVGMQILYVIFETPEYMKRLRDKQLEEIFEEILEFVEESDNLEWGYFRNKQLSRNLIKSLILFIGENFQEIESKLSSCEQVFKNKTVIRTLTYCAYSEYLMITRRESDRKDYQSIITNEYVAVSEYFLHSHEIKFFNGILNGILSTVSKAGKTSTSEHETSGSVLDNNFLKESDPQITTAESIHENDSTHKDFSARPPELSEVKTQSECIPRDTNLI